MNFTERQSEIASRINGAVEKIAQKAKTREAMDEALIAMMPAHMGGFKHLLDSLEPGGMDRLCEEFPGFYQFAQMMERIARGCRDGLFDDIIKRS
ncbi:hypothetical protein [Edaphovirga cremea]|uniref:hypothetical protein n=1 Tax=Edaphovirga cremea TaxID=2267246 RepID=UPI0039896937